MTANITIKQKLVKDGEFAQLGYRVTLQCQLVDRTLNLETQGTDSLALLLWAYGRATDFIRRGT